MIHDRDEEEGSILRLYVAALAMTMVGAMIGFSWGFAELLAKS